MYKFSLKSLFTDCASLAFLVGPFSSICLAPFFLRGFDRFGSQWFVVLFSALIAAGLFAFRGHFSTFLVCFFSSRYIVALYSVFLSWMLLLIWVHGILPQLESVLSLLFFLLILPVLIYLASFSRRKWSFSLVASIMLLTLLTLENVYLLRYLFLGESFNGVNLFFLQEPRLFINSRDGNYLALGQVLACFVAIKHWCGSYRRLPRLSNLVVSLYGALSILMAGINAWLTQGRGLLLSLLLFVISLFVLAIRNRSFIDFALGMFSSAALLLSFLLFKLISAVSVVSQARASIPESLASSFIERESAGRFELWFSWLQSGLGHSWLWGHGLGFLPAANRSIQVTPHNIFVQMISDAGLSGLVVLVLLFLLFISSPLSKLRLPWVLCLALPLGLYFSVGSVLFWPSGVWVSSILLISVLELVYQEFPAAGPVDVLAICSASGNKTFLENTLARFWLFAVIFIVYTLSFFKLSFLFP